MGKDKTTPFDPGDLSGLSQLDLQPPQLRPGLVFRRDLVERLASTEADVITLTAPAGYGKSAVLAQWAEAEEKPLAWLNLGQHDNDVTNLMFHVALSLSHLGIIQDEDVAAFRFSGGENSISRGPARLARALRQRQSPWTLVLDQAEVLRSRASSDALAELVYQTEGLGRIVIATRSKARVPVAVLRSRGRLLELTQDDLAMSAEEIRAMVATLGLNPDVHAAGIAETSAGWPVVVYLLALAVRSGAPEEKMTGVGGDDRFLSEYIRAEILSRLSPSRHEFLKLVSPLDRFNVPLCDVVTQSQDSGRTLRALVESTHLVLPLDRTNTWYVVSRVVREALYSELLHDSPETARLVHDVAAEWYEQNGLPEQAIIHAQKAGDVERFARLMSQLARIRYATGGAPGVLDWMGWFESETSLELHPDVAAIGALVHAIEGNALAAERWMDAAMSASGGKQVPPIVYTVRALGTRAGVPQMIEDARTAREALSPGSEWLAGALLAEGLAHVWIDELDVADSLLAEATSIGMGIQGALTTTLALAERGLIALRRGDWNLASDLSSRSMRSIDELGLESYVTSGLGFVVAARCARNRNDIPKTKTLLARAATVRPRLNSTLPGLAVQTLLEMATTHIELSDVAGARILLAEATEVVIQRPDLGLLPQRLAEIKESIRNLGPGTIRPSSLTNSELRLLPLLATHLTFPEIGERLFISRHTVKTEATSIYRKLGASSRSEAVAKSVEFGLLPS